MSLRTTGIAWFRSRATTCSAVLSGTYSESSGFRVRQPLSHIISNAKQGTRKDIVLSRNEDQTLELVLLAALTSYLSPMARFISSTVTRDLAPRLTVNQRMLSLGGRDRGGKRRIRAGRVE